jgi:lysophospholipase L1-like esterase
MTRPHIDRKRGRWLSNLAVLAITAVLLFGACEITIRLIQSHRQIEESWAIHDQDVGYRLRPGFRDVSADGLRDDPVETPKQRFRILMLGDSLAFNGDDKDDTFPAHLERALRMDARLASAEVLNAGVQGYTNYQELVYLRKYGIRFEPDLVGVAFVLNDLHRILTEFQIEDGKIVGEKYMFSDTAVQAVDSPLYQLARKSRFLVWLRHRLSVFDDLIDVYVGQGFTFDYRPDFNTAWREEPWRDIEAQLGEMVRLGRERGFGVFLVAFPFGEQMRPDYLARDREYVLYPQRKLAEITARLGIAYLDLFDALDPKADLEADRIHLTKRGRVAAGERIARFLIQQDLVPAHPASR